MTDRLKFPWAARQIVRSTVVASILLAPNLVPAAETDFSAEPTWQPGDAEAAFRQLEAFVRSSTLPADRQSTVLESWWGAANSPENPSNLLDRLATCLAQADERVSRLVAFCSQTDRPAILPDFSWLANSETPPLVRYNMRLYYARWLAQNGYDDEALSWTDGLTTADVVSPESLLFYRSIASHRLVQADRADATLAELLQRSDELPLRYQKIAHLMQQDLSGLEDESLDHISRRMADVRRRLDLGRAGKAVQGVENGVIDSLDKLIEKVEQQAQQQCQSGAAGGQPSGTPMQDSRLAELKAPGKVDPRDIGHGADWGDMPDKDREQALQEVGREFPSHYREVIEAYFRRLAAEESDDNPN